jgi:hypothetical protein
MPYKYREDQKDNQNLFYAIRKEKGLCFQCGVKTTINKNTGKPYVLCREHRVAASLNRVGRKDVKKLREDSLSTIRDGNGRTLRENGKREGI